MTHHYSIKHLSLIALLAWAFFANAAKNTSGNPQNFTTKHAVKGFEENIGQVSGKDQHRVKFQLQQHASTVFLLNNAIAYQFMQAHHTGDTNELYESIEDKMKHTRYSTYRMDMQLVGANPDPEISKLEKLSHFNRYSSAGMEQVHFYEKVIYHNVYPNIDWVFFINESGIKHEFVVHPGGNPDMIKFEAKWAEKMQLDPQGNLVLENRLGQVTENKPISLQGKQTIESRFVIQDQYISYAISSYNRNETLIIDPQLIWGTYYGSAGSDGANSVSTDSQGNVYFCGSTQSFSGIAEGGFLNVNNSSGAFSAFLVKFNAAGQRIWGTYYGTQAFITSGLGCATDQQDNVYLVGTTDAITGISFNGQQNFLAGPFSSDGYLVKFAPDGQRIWATYYGGSLDDGFDAITIDNSNNIYVAGGTNSTDYPLLNAFQSNPGANIGGESNANIVKFNTQGQVLYSTYLGGSAEDRIFGITHNSMGDIFVCGRTTSTDFPLLNAHQSINGSVFSTPFDGFLSKFNSSGNLLWSTYYGGSDSDVAYSVAVDKIGNVYLAGNTGSQNNIAANGFQNSISLGSASFLAKFNTNGVRQWGTYFGFSPDDFGSNANFGWGCATDSDNNVYLAGRTRGTENVAFQGFQNQLIGFPSVDAYIAKFNGNGTRLWATYYGGQENDGIRGCHMDPSNQLYVVGSSNSPNNIFLQGFQSTQQDDECIIAKIGCPTPSIFNIPQEVCANTSIQLSPLPTGGNLQLNGSGSLAGNTYNTPEVSVATEVSFTYSINAIGQCPAASNNFTLTIQPNITPNLSVTSTNLVICQGEEITFNAILTDAGENPSVNWLVNNESAAENTLTFASSTLQNNAQVQCVLQSNASCANPSTISSSSLVVTVNPLPVINAFFSDIDGGALVATPGFSSYQWFVNGTVIAGATNSFYIPEQNGVYAVVATNQFGCSSSADVIIQVVALPVLENFGIRVFPNPATEGFIFIETDASTPKNIQLINSIGAIVYTSFTDDAQLRINTEALAPGVYLISVDFDKKRFTQKIVVSGR